MGRHCGSIALASAVAGGAEAVMVPEVPFTDDQLADRIGAAIARGKRSAIVVVSEGARPGGAAEVARHVGARLALDYRVTARGHVQRGGSPSAADRILGAVLGVEAITALAEGERGAFVGESAGRVVRIPYRSMTDARAELDPHLTVVATQLG
jgi:6-phosphofructokinase 1